MSTQIWISFLPLKIKTKHFRAEVLFGQISNVTFLDSLSGVKLAKVTT